jgi:hypothetical protein
MEKQRTPSAAIGFQVDLFGASPVKKIIAKPAPIRNEPLKELALQYGDVRATARRYAIKKGEVYHVVFSDNRKPLVITLAERPNGKDFWTSLPEGRQQEAEDIGRLIDSALME